MLVSVCGFSHAFAHADLEEQIARLTIELESAPTNADLFLRRADVFRRHLQVAEALKDYAEAQRLKPGWTAATLGRAQLFFDVGHTREAIDVANQVLSTESNSPAALVLRAECHVKLNEHEAAIADYSAAIQYSSDPQPDLFIERANLQAELKQWDAAVAGLDAGMKKLGEIPQLELAAVAYERQRGNFPGALERVNRMVARYPVNEPWVALRAEILEQSNRLDEAREDYQRVVAGIESYPPGRRGLEPTKRLESSAREGLARVESKLAAKSKTLSSLNPPR